MSIKRAVVKALRQHWIAQLDATSTTLDDGTALGDLKRYTDNRSPGSDINEPHLTLDVMEVTGVGYPGMWKRRLGEVVIGNFVPVNSGAEDLLTLKDFAVEVFEDKTIAVSGEPSIIGGAVKFRTASERSGPPQARFTQENVVIPFHYDEQKS